VVFLSQLNQGYIAKMLGIRENGMIYRGPGFSRGRMAYALTPPPLMEAGRLRKIDTLLMIEGGKWGGRGAESYDHKKAWSNINNSTLSAGNVLSTY
jgi:hypothetical protein